jgi:hypothetical protein
MVLSHAKTSRPGVSLTEVLVAMFVMALGMIALMTLFPLGAMQVGQALRDDRASQLARQADGYLRQWWRHEIVPNPNNTESAFWALDDPNLILRKPVGNGVFLDCYLGTNTSYAPVSAVGPGFQLLTNSNIATPAVPTSPFILIPTATYPPLPAAPVISDFSVQVTLGSPTSRPSYPVMIDPNRFKYQLGSMEMTWVARSSVATPYGLLLPRRSTNAALVINPPTQTKPLIDPIDLAGLTDDMSFTPNGAPQGGTVIGRQGRFTWTAVIQRPRNDVRTVADLHVLVYDQRPVLPQPRDEYVGPPDVAATTGTRTITVTLPNRGENQAVLIRRGGWVIDGTIDTSTTPTAAGIRRNFLPYRISGITEGATNTTATLLAPFGTTTFDIDLETPLKADLTTSSQLYFLAGLIEVFQRPQLRPDVNY